MNVGERATTSTLKVTSEKESWRAMYTVLHLHSQKFTSHDLVLFYLLNEIRKFYKKIKKISFLKSALKTIFLAFKLKTLPQQHKLDLGCGLVVLKLQKFQAKF